MPRTTAGPHTHDLRLGATEYFGPDRVLQLYCTICDDSGRFAIEAEAAALDVEAWHGWHPSFFEGHEDDGHGGCIRCRFWVPHTDDEYTVVPYPCPFAAYADAIRKRGGA